MGVLSGLNCVAGGNRLSSNRLGWAGQPRLRRGLGCSVIKTAYAHKTHKLAKSTPRCCRAAVSRVLPSFAAPHSQTARHWRYSVSHHAMAHPGEAADYMRQAGIGRLMTMPFLIINLGAEMLYILEQRLQAQSIASEKSKKGVW